MTMRAHHILRLGALALLVAMAVWPRTRVSSSGAEVARAAAAQPGGEGRSGGRRSPVATTRETAGARPATAPRAKLVATTSDESLTN